MHIIDWSSDVCSSDLGVGSSGSSSTINTIVLTHGRCWTNADGSSWRPIAALFADAGTAAAREINSTGRWALHTCTSFTPAVSTTSTRIRLRDRKSVVQGKSVVVRGDLGGLRIN